MQDDNAKKKLFLCANLVINVEELKEILIELEEAREAVYKCYQRLGSISEVEIGRTADGSSISGSK